MDEMPRILPGSRGSPFDTSRSILQVPTEQLESGARPFASDLAFSRLYFLIFAVESWRFPHSARHEIATSCIYTDVYLL